MPNTRVKLAARGGGNARNGSIFWAAAAGRRLRANRSVTEGTRRRDAGT